MDVESFRIAEKLTLEQLAGRLDVSSKGYLSDLLRGRQDWPVELALRMQLVSEGRVLARDLVPADKRELLDQLSGQGATPAAEAAA